jgi:hypothetical protein
VTKALPGRRRPRWQGGTGLPRLRPIRRCWAMAVMPKCSSAGGGLFERGAPCRGHRLCRPCLADQSA